MPMYTKRLFWAFVCASILFLLAFGLTMIGPDRMPRVMLRDPGSEFLTIFLPHGIKILGAWMTGWFIVPILLPAVVLANFLLKGWQAFTGVQLLLSVAGLVTAPLAFDMLHLAGFGINGRARHRMNWKLMLLVGLISSILNFAIYLAAGQQPLVGDSVVLAAGRFMIGDVMGVLGVMVIAMLVFRFIRLSRR